MKFPAKYTVAIQILCICHLTTNAKITSNYIASRTGADPSIIRNTMLSLKKNNYITSKPGPGGTTLNANLADISLYDLYELVASSEESLLKINKLPSTAVAIDEGIARSTESIFASLQEELFLKMRTISVLDICNNISM